MKNYPKSVEALFTDTPGQEEEIIELTDVVNDLAGRQEEIIELTDIIAEPPPLADRESQAFVDLTDEIVPVDKTTGTDPIIELSEIASTAETTAGSAVEDPKFYEPIGEDDVIALVDQISSQIDKDAGSDELPIETLDDAHVAELIDLNEEVDSVIQEPATFTIPRDGSELKPDLPADTFALDDHALKAGMENPDELDFEMMDELAVRLDQDIDGHTSEVAEQLGKAMQETKANEALPAETEEEFSLSLESIRNKLDSVFPDDETTALPNAIGLFETSAQAPPVSEEVDLPELLFPETAPERQPAQALFTGVETETQLSPSIPKTAEPPADMPELHFPEVQFDPDMPQFAYPDLDPEPDMPEHIVQKVEPSPDMPEYIPAAATQPEAVLAKTEARPAVPLEAMVVSSVVRAMGTVTDQQIESALAHVIKTLYGEKIEQLIVEIIEKTVSQEIYKIKTALLDEADRLT